jgi:hypothetical protein
MHLEKFHNRPFNKDALPNNIYKDNDFSNHRELVLILLTICIKWS